MNVLAATSSTASPLDVIAAIALIVVAFAVYWVPTFVAARRKVPNVGSVVIVNLFLGWTIIGWVVALVLAMRDPRPAV